ncbi:MAG: hypothetical protein ABJA50_01115 [Chloroflexota bacterium]
MTPVYIALLITLTWSITSVLLSWLYFRRFQVTRPPIGVFNFTDVAFMIVGIVLVPYLYLLLPTWLVAGLLVIGTLSIMYFLWEPILRAPLLVWLVSLILVVADIWASIQFGTATNGYFIVNNIITLTLVVGLTNLWAQSGMKARDAAILGGFLTIYDLVATWLLPLMSDMMTRLAGLPFSPMMAWGVGDGGGLWVAIGLGDLLLAALFPLVMRKAYGFLAGFAAMLIALFAISALMLFPIATIFPAMIVLGPLMVLQYLYWSRRQGRERTTWQYLQAEVLRVSGQ